MFSRNGIARLCTVNVFLLLALFSVATTTSAVITGVSALCTNPAPLTDGSVINVAILTWLIGEPNGLYKGSSIADTQATRLPGYGRTFIQPHMLGVDLFIQQMRKQGNVVPLSNANQSVSFNFVYINMGGLDFSAVYANASASVSAVPGTTTTTTNYSSWGAVDYSNVGPTGFPWFLTATTSRTIPTSAGYPGGMFWKVVSQDPAVLMANFGIDAPFTFIIPPSIFGSAASGTLLNLVEYPTPTAVVINPFMTAEEDCRCDGLPAATSRSPDCLVAPSYAPDYGTGVVRNRRQGARRFEALFSVMVDTTANQQSALEEFHQLHVGSIVILVEALQAKSPNYFPRDCAAATVDAAGVLGINVLDTISLVEAVCVSSVAGFVPPANCPPPTIKDQTHVWNNSLTGLDIARYIAALNPDALIILGSPSSSSSWSLAQLFRGLQTIEWTPKAISVGGGTENSIRPFLASPSTDLTHIFTATPWDWRLKGPSYKAVKTETNFELLPAEADKDAPQVFQEAYDAAYGPSADGTVPAHPMWNQLSEGNVAHAEGYAALNLAMKIVEKALTSDVSSLIQAAKSISQPSMYHQADFDVYGRISLKPQVLKQIVPLGAAPIIYPFNIGGPALYPLPTWKERVFAPKWYGDTSERVMVGFNTVCIGVCLAVMALVFFKRQQPVFKAASPLFCMAIILGAVLMLTSNYFDTLTTNDAHCAARAWLLSLGFTLMFASLFVKTFRLWRIFCVKQLKVQKIMDTDLLIGVVCFLLMDVAINVAWMETAGMRSMLTVVDVNRPAYNYLSCDYSSSMPAVWTHVGLKAFALSIGVVLAYSVRNISSDFNESMMIGLALYNVSICVCFVLPILSAGLGRKTTYLVKAFAVMFISLSTVGLLFIPKFVNASLSVSSQNKTKNKTNSTPIPIPTGRAITPRDKVEVIEFNTI